MGNLNIEAYDAESLRRLVRFFEYENKLLKDKLRKENIPYDDINPFEETIDNSKEYDPDQGERIISPEFITEKMAKHFFSMFWGREDVYAKRGKSGGYFPQCDNRWEASLCPKQRGEKVSCYECENTKWKCLDAKIIITHLLGKKEDGSDVIGVYPLLPNGTCRFIVFDFDNHEKGAEKTDFANTDNEWHKEVDALRKMCEINGIKPLVERSRSGRGAHVWIFFKKAIPASLARNFGFLLLDKGATSINFKSFHYYDRMYPSQDVAISIGNLIALPLQGQALKNGNSAFVDENWNAYPNQWVDELNKFLDIKEEPPEYETKTGRKKKRDSVIGILHGNKNTLTGIVDVAMVGSMYSKGNFNELINSYGMVIMDECHHAASNTSMELLQKINAKYVYGVSATPKRGDSLDKIIYMLLGPLRHRFTALERAQEQGIGHYFVPRYTRVVDTVDSRDDINKAYSLISSSKVRNDMIVGDVKKCVSQNQTPVILTRVKEHAKLLYDALKSEADHVFIMYGDNSDKENADIRVKLKQVPKTDSLILVATGQKIGEGFDFPRLDVLMLAAPVSFEGRLEQYVGRLNRDYEGKEAVYVYDYIDTHMRFFNKMYGKRLKTYKRMGFSIWTGDETTKQTINAIYDSGNYTEKFERDIVEADKSIVISSPDIRQNKVERLLLLIKDRQEKGVHVTVITTDPEKVVYGSVDVCHYLINQMKQVGIYVVVKAEVEERFAVIDDELVWHGGMNLLGKVDVWDNLMRVRNHQVAAELLEISLGAIEES